MHRCVDAKRAIAGKAGAPGWEAPCSGPMASDLLTALHQRMEEDLPGLTVTPDGLQTVADCRYGEVVLEVDHDPEAESIRVGVAIPPPAGSGPDFLLFCLALNAQYWDVKTGLDEEGRLLVHADLDADAEGDLDALATEVVDRIDTVLELLDDDLTEWLLDAGLGTPAQRERWIARAETESDEAGTA